MKRFRFFLSLLTLLFGKVQAQTPDGLVNRMPQLGQSATASVYLYDALLQRLQEPLDVNQATLTDLLWLGLPTKAAHDLLTYRARFGAFESLNELHQIDGFDSLTIQALLPFLDCKPVLKLPASYKDFISDARSNWLQIRTRVSTTTATSWPVQPLDQLIRYRYQGNSGLAIGLMLQQDAGELYRLSTRQLGFDFASGYVALPLKAGKSEKLILGDFAMNAGHRLVLGNGYVGGFGQAILPAEGYKSGLLPWTSAIEAGFFRGIATSKSITLTERMAINVQPFASYALQDSRLQWQDSLGMNTITGLPLTGYHRTAAELAGRQQTGQWAVGGTMGLTINDETGFRQTNLGLNLLNTAWSAPLRLLDGASNLRFEGQHCLNISVSGNHQFNSSYLSAELATSFSAGSIGVINEQIAFSVEWLKALGRNYTLQIRGRSYGSQYYAPFGASLGQSGYASGERGLTLAVQRQDVAKWSLTLQSDLFQITAPRYRLDKVGSIGSENAVSVGRALGFNTKVRGSVRYRLLERNVTGFEGLVLPTHTTYLVTSLQHVWPVGIKSTHQVAGASFFQTNMTYGWSCLNAANAQITRRLGLSVFLLLYQSQSFDARTYLNEPQILWYQQIPYLGGYGSRLGVVSNFKLNHNLRLDLKYAKVYGDRPDDQVWLQLMINLAKTTTDLTDFLLW